MVRDMSAEGREIYERQRAQYREQQDELVRRDVQAARDRHYANYDPSSEHDVKKGKILDQRVKDAKTGSSHVEQANKGCTPVIILVAIGSLAATGAMVALARNAEAAPTQPATGEPQSIEQLDADYEYGAGMTDGAGAVATSLLVSIEDSGYMRPSDQQ